MKSQKGTIQMSILDMPNYLWITLVAVLLLTAFFNLILGRWFIMAILSFVVLGVLAFFIPNFQDITYEPLLGYAAFVGVLSLIESILIWYFTKDWRRKRREKQLERALHKHEH